MGFAGNQPNRKNIDFTPQASAPSDAVAGSTIYHSTSGLIFYTGTEWVPTSGTGGGASNIDDLTDVDTAGVSTADSLVYNGSRWVPSGVTGGGGASALNDLTDVNTAGLATDEALVYNGSTWVPAPMDLSTNVVGDLADIDDIDVAGLANGSGLSYNQSSKMWEVTNYNLGHHTTGDIEDLDNVTLSATASGNLLQYNGSDWVNIESTPMEGYVWKIIGEGTATGSEVATTVDFNGSGYKQIEVTLTDISVTLDTIIKATCVDSTDSDITSSYRWTHMGGSSNASNPRVHAGTSQSSNPVQYSENTSNWIDSGSAGRTAFKVTILNPSEHDGTTPLHMQSEGSFFRPDGQTVTTQGSMIYTGSTAAHKIKFEAGNASADVTCKYVVKALVPLNTTAVYEIANLGDLTDVTAGSPSSGDMLRYNGSNWESYTTDLVQVDRIVQSVDSFSSTTEIETVNFDDYNDENISRVEWYIFDIDVSADLSLELIAQTHSGDVVTDNTGASDYCWHLDGGAAAGEFGQGDNADDSIFLSFNDNTTRYDTTVDGRGSARILWVNPAEHMASPNVVPAHFEYSTSMIRPDGSFQSHYGHGFYYGALGPGDMCTAFKVKSHNGSSFTGSHNVVIKIEKRL